MLSSKEIAENYLNVGRRKGTMPLGSLFVLAVLAGAFIALAGAGATAASCMVANPSLSKLISACLFPGGLAMVVLAGAELFTGNCLMVLPLLQKTIGWRQVLRNWLTVYAGNLAGSLLVAAVCAYSHQLGLFSNGLAVSTLSTAAAKCALPFGDVFLRGVACNFLVCMAVWLALGAQGAGGKIAALYFPILLFVACGFEHSVANMYYIGAGLFARTVPAYAQAAAEAGVSLDALTLSGFAGNLLPATLGNIVGGGAVGWAFWFCHLRKN